MHTTAPRSASTADAPFFHSRAEMVYDQLKHDVADFKLEPHLDGCATLP